MSSQTISEKPNISVEFSLQNTYDCKALATCDYLTRVLSRYHAVIREGINPMTLSVSSVGGKAVYELPDSGPKVTIEVKPNELFSRRGLPKRIGINIYVEPAEQQLIKDLDAQIERFELPAKV